MDPNTRIAIMHQVGHCLAAHGTMTQYQYEISKLQPGGFQEERFLREYFAQVSVRRVILNLPPTLVFTCRERR
jgi:phospholipid N-methyltransferase